MALLLECCSLLLSWEELQHAKEAEEGRELSTPTSWKENTAEKRRRCILLENALGRVLDFFPGPDWIQWFVSHGVSEIKSVQLLDQHRQPSTL